MSLLLPVQLPLEIATLSLLSVPRPQVTLPAQRWSSGGPQGHPVQTWGSASASEGSLVPSSRGHQNLRPGLGASKTDGALEHSPTTA